MSPKGIRNSVYPKACGNSPLCVIIGVLECKGPGLGHGAEARARVQVLKGQENGEQI